MGPKLCLMNDAISDSKSKLPGASGRSLPTSSYRYEASRIQKVQNSYIYSPSLVDIIIIINIIIVFPSQELSSAASNEDTEVRS